jgi:hypothetical protein
MIYEMDDLPNSEAYPVGLVTTSTFLARRFWSQALRIGVRHPLWPTTDRTEIVPDRDRAAVRARRTRRVDRRSVCAFGAREPDGALCAELSRRVRKGHSTRPHRDAHAARRWAVP